TRRAPHTTPFPSPTLFRSRDPESAPDAPDIVTIGFEHGVPVTIDGERLDPFSLLSRANDIAGLHGVGRVDIVENRFVGMKSRGRSEEHTSELQSRENLVCR